MAKDYIEVKSFGKVFPKKGANTRMPYEHQKNAMEQRGTNLIELYYDSFDLACIIRSLDLGTRTAGAMLEKIWQHDSLYLIPYYRTNLRGLYLDVHYWIDYLCDKPVIDREFPSIQKDFLSFGKALYRNREINY